MRRLPLKQILMLVAALATIIFLFSMSQGVHPRNHQAISEIIHQLLRYEEARQRDVLKFRSGLAWNYDSLIAAEQRLDQLYAELEGRITGVVSNEDAGSLHVLVAEYGKELGQQNELVDQFRSGNALVSNSLQFFPGEAKEILRITTLMPNQYLLSQNIERLLQDILFFARDREAITQEKIAGQIEKIRKSSPILSERMDARLERLIAHAEIIIGQKEAVDLLMTGYLANSSVPILNQILEEWNAFYQRDQGQAEIFRMALFAASLFLLAYVISMFVSLARAKLRLQDFAETLEEKILSRTAELAGTNERLEAANVEKTALLGDFDAIYETIDHAILFFDQSQRLRTTNRAAIEMFDLPPSLIAERPDFLDLVEASDLSDLFEATLHNTAQGARSKKSALMAFLADGDGRSRELMRPNGQVLEYRCKALPDGSRMVTFLDISERIQTEMQLAHSKSDLEARVQELETLQLRLESSASEAIQMTEELTQARSQLADAVDSISEGFALWDQDSRLIMCNEQYRQMYPGLDHIIRPGLHFSEFTRAAYEQGVFELEEESLETAIKSREARHRTSISAFEQKLGDGRWVRVSKRRTATGHVVGILTDISQRKQSEATIQRMALEDALTSLPNRSKYHENLRSALDQADRTGNLVGVMLLDLDHFKIINDTFGHPVGDALLKQVSARLLDCARKTDTVARLGGDEFAIIVTNAAEFANVSFVAERVVEAITKPFFIEGKEIHTGTSIGVTVYPNDRGSPDQLLRNADLALYRAKEDGRGTFRLYDERMHIEVQERRAVEEDLRVALNDGQFFMVYQPQFNMTTREVIGAEALLRWYHPKKGTISPSEFVPIAETTRLIIPISEWILEEVCRRATLWRDDGLNPIPLSVNLSPLQFRQKDMADQVEEVLRRTGLDPQWLELEITESMAMAGGDETKGILEQLKKIGVSLAIDDFGTGYSSLNRLKQFPVDRLKIDQSFVRDITTDWNDAAISSAVIQLGHSLNLKVIAEGVESEDQLNFLINQGCDEAQGFYFSRPLSAEDFGDFLKMYKPTQKNEPQAKELQQPRAQPKEREKKGVQNAGTMAAKQRSS
ncbi:MAG: EAL domain-containing protein [Pseudomonadota bacterium]